ncbi:amidase [Paenarthrobacter sp. NPDC089675]|uniref:amidase n=1 Tax=Paenarthrobacter sp. NPDC089675 TaxID=3364376 RepID=UPI00381A6427
MIAPVQTYPVPANSAAYQLKQCRQRSNGHEDPLRAVISWNSRVDQDAAQADAEAAAGINRGPLHGHLIMIKDNIDTAGLRTTAGASFWSNRVPQQDAEVVRRLRASGIVIAAKTNMSEVALGATNSNAAYGDCLNAWDTARISGGSSGGSAAALAADYCQLALGTDTGGSVRIPASLNGVLGLRPSFGRISTQGVVPLSPSQDVVGPMGRTAFHVATLTDILTDGKAERSVAGQATARIGEPLTGMVVGVVQQFGSTHIDSDIQSAVEAFAKQLGLLGAVIRDVGIEDWEAAAPIWSKIAPYEAAKIYTDRLQSSPDDFTPDVLRRLRQGAEITSAEYSSALEDRAAFQARMNARFVNFDVILTPTTPVTAPRRDSSPEQQAAVGALVHPWALHLGPTLSVPAGFDSAGMPVGVSLSARVGHEATLFQVAHAYEQLQLRDVRRP